MLLGRWRAPGALVTTVTMNSISSTKNQLGLVARGLHGPALSPSTPGRGAGPVAVGAADGRTAAPFEPQALRSSTPPTSSSAIHSMLAYVKPQQADYYLAIAARFSRGHLHSILLVILVRKNCVASPKRWFVSTPKITLNIEIVQRTDRVFPNLKQ